MILQIKRGNRVIAESADFSYSPSLQEVRKLTCEVVSVVPIEFKAYNSKSESEYDTVVYNGNTFILYQAPSGDNLNEAGKYKYSLLFYGKEVLLQNVAFLDIVSGTGGEINKIRYTHGGLFQFWGDAKQLAARIEANIESYNASLGAGYTGIGTWTLNVDAEGELTEDMIDITDGTNLFEALKNFYDKFYLNYYFSTTANGGIITITDKTRPSVNWTFKQGDGGGAVKVSSSVDTSTPVITRIIPQGGSRNVPPEYKKGAKPADESRYCPYILLPNDSDGNIRYYIDSEYGLKNYGVRGKTISNTFSGIYPSIRGKKLGDLYPSGLPEWDTYKADGEPDPQSGKVAGEGASAATRIDKIIGSTPIKSDDSDSFFIYMTSPGFNLGYKVYEDGDSSDKINDNVQPQYKPHAMFDKYRDFESFDIYSTRAYYDQPVKVTATFSGKMLFSVLPIGSDAVGKKVKINLRMVTNRVLGQASPLKEVVIGEEGATGMLEIPYDKTALVGYIEKGQNTTVTIRVEFTFDSDVPAGSCKIGFSEEMTCNIHFGNQDGSQDRFYYKYASVTDAVFSMRTGTYTGTEFKINKNGIIPLYGEVNGDTGETEEDVSMFNKGARYKISCYRTDSDNAKLPLYTDGKSPSIAAGTEFVILNIVMPESYVTMAENTLEKAALDYLSRYDHENRTVSLDISSGFVAEHPNLFIDFIEGNMLKVRDDGIGVFDFSDNGQIVDMQLQIQSLEIKYSKENMFPSYSCTIARRKILSFYERLAQENQTASTQNTTNVTLGGSGTESDNLAELLALKADKTITISAGTGLTGGGNLSANRTLSLATTGVKAGTYTKVTVDTYGRVTVGDNPTTLAGYGITDAYTQVQADKKFVTLATDQAITGNKTFTNFIRINDTKGLSYSGNTVFRNSSGNTVISSFGDGMIYFRPNGDTSDVGVIQINKQGHLNGVSAGFTGGVSAARLTANEYIQIGDAQLVYDSANKALRVKHRTDGNTVGFYSDGWVSALGVKTGGSGGGSGVVNTVYSFADLTDGTTFSDSDLDNTFNAYTIKKLYDMAGQGGLDADAMWAELKKADSSKIIDASHIPTSVLDGRWVKKTGDTMTGTLTSASTNNAIIFKGLENCDITNFYTMNGTLDSNSLTAIRNGLRFNWYYTYWYIGNIRGKSTDSNGFGIANESHKLCLQVTPNNTIAPVFRSTASQGTAPLIVNSTTQVSNLNADLLDGLHENSFLRYRDSYGIDGYDTLWAQIGIRQYNNAKPDGMANPIYNNGAVISLPGKNTRLDIWYNHTSSASDSPTNGIQYRSGWGDDRKPWRMLLDNVNYASYSDGRYVKKSGDTMTGDLTMNDTKGFNIGWSTRVVKTSGNWIHGGADVASSTDANLRFASWNGIGWYPSFSGGSVAQGNNAMWLNVRTGVLDVHSNITSHNGYLAANWDSDRRLVLGGGSSYAWIDLRNSSNNKMLNNIVLDNSYTGTSKEMRAPYFKSTVGTGTQPYQCSSTTLNTNLNADMLDNWHLNFLPRNYNNARTYSVQFALGGKDNGWKKIFACSESEATPYRSVTVWGQIWYAHGNHAQSEVWNYHFCAIFSMRSGPSASDSSVGNVDNLARLYLPTFAKGMDNIRLVRVGKNNFELQVRQIDSYHNGHIQYQYWSYGCNVFAWENLQSTSNTSVAVSAGGASTLADSRASSADVWTSARTFYIQDHNAAHTGAGVSVNGSANVYLKLPNSIQCGDWFRSTGNSGWCHQDYGGGIYMQDSTYVRVYGGKRFYVGNTENTNFSTNTAISTGGGIYAKNNITSNANIIANGAITAKASSSDIRLKTDIQGYDAMGIIRKFRSVKYHWNNLAKRNSEIFNHKKWNYGLIAQDLLSGGYSQWVSDIFKDYYTIDYERLIPVVWKGLQEVDDEVTRLKKRVKELEKRLGINNK